MKTYVRKCGELRVRALGEKTHEIQGNFTATKALEAMQPLFWGDHMQVELYRHRPNDCTLALVGFSTVDVATVVLHLWTPGVVLKDATDMIGPMINNHNGIEVTL